MIRLKYIFGLIIYFIFSVNNFSQSINQSNVEKFVQSLIDQQPKKYAFEFNQKKEVKFFTENDTVSSNDHIILICDNGKKWLKKTGGLWQTLIKSDSIKEIYDYRDSTIYFSKDDGSLGDIIETFAYEYKSIFNSHKLSFERLDTLVHEYRLTVQMIQGTDSLISNYKAIITFRKKDLLPVCFETFMTFQEMNQYIKWNISNIKSIKPNEELIVFDKSLKVKKIVNCREGRILADFKKYFDTPLKEKTFFTFFGDSLNLQHSKPKIILFDFFYSSCFPCRKSIPVLNSLYGKYKSQGVMIIGINNIDDKAHIDALLKTNPIIYPVVSNKSIEEQFNITSYPTLLVFDENYKFINGFVGYNSDMERDISILIKELLKL